MKPSPTAPNAPGTLLPRGARRVVPIWLLCLVLTLGLVLGQAAGAGSGQIYHPDASLKVAGETGQAAERAPGCHPGLACTAFVLLVGPVTDLSLSVVVARRPDVPESQRRFGGPSVTLPPPRTLT